MLYDMAFPFCKYSAFFYWAAIFRELMFEVMSLMRFEKVLSSLILLSIFITDVRTVVWSRLSKIVPIS